MSEAWHVYPLDDDVEHFTDGTGCWCGPDLEFIERGDGEPGYVVHHHALDPAKDDR